MRTGGGAYGGPDLFHVHRIMQQDLTVHSKRNPNKLLLQNVSGQVTGGFWAGKTTRGRERMGHTR